MDAARFAPCADGRLWRESRQRVGPAGGLWLVQKRASAPKSRSPVLPQLFIAVREKDGKETLWLAETKAELSTNVPLKNGAAEQWCKKMSTTRCGQWGYLYAQQLNREKAMNKGATTFEQLATILAL